MSEDELTPEGDPTDDAVRSVGTVPVLAVVGRPNVGKSTLVNRIIGRREAVVQDIPGVTRDRVSYDAEWNGRAFTLVDTGGWDPDARGMAERIRAQAEIAVGLADAVLFVVDATIGITDADEAVVRVLRRADKKVVLVANKVDDERAEAQAFGLWNLGLGEPHMVSALHGRGSGDLLDAVLEVLPPAPEAGDEVIGGPRRIAIVGRPNVGKSSLLNKLAGEERSVVDNVAGTTVDPVDEIVDMGGKSWRFIDTAGIRKRVKEASGHEYYAWLRTSTAIERAEVCVLVLDGSESVAEQDMRILQEVREAGKALVIAFNKWDKVDAERRYFLDREIERDLVQVLWAPRINLTALTGWHIDRLVPALEKAIEGWETRITTGAFNAFLGRIVAEHPHPVRGGKQPRILFGSQVQSAPPTFKLFTSGQLDAGYLRFIERRLREEFGFVGTPIEMKVQAREKRKRT
ncbi:MULTISPECIES: ribosome biogenesis GTPase Der [unclassified Nocardioides]|uniref:ribosome biogenesis GTPase Der n=1 Tax=unclassified Nocardioides TaxID=2615069 RepID=UPI0006F25B7A|nr:MULTISPECIES: ribosome biogenesis GTPase Der [unclassified Nocardioides]KRA27246.1 ribosome-associated GTPase EngA [Nocardioides sp. Root614]KRA91122.1 ribosome-associated GTPase EngA [Nocardioides sp. Root682]